MTLQLQLRTHEISAKAFRADMRSAALAYRVIIDPGYFQHGTRLSDAAKHGETCLRSAISYRDMALRREQLAAETRAEIRRVRPWPVVPLPNPFRKDTWDITRQMRILASDPRLAVRLKEAAAA